MARTTQTNEGQPGVKICIELPDALQPVIDRFLDNFTRNRSEFVRYQFPVAFGGLLNSAYESLRRKAQGIEIKIETLDFVMKQSVPHYYIRNTERVSYKDWRLIGLFHLEADEDEKAMRDIAYRHIDRPSELRIELSLRRIKAPYPRRILKKALKYGYKFPTTLKKAVPLSSIRRWILSKEPTM